MYRLSFDSVLESKLKFYGIGARALSWLTSYLAHRYQRVDIDEESKSSFQQVISGVPQGSILGPLLFLIYSNDLPEVISNAKIVLYADDTSVKAKYKNKQSLSTLLTDQFKQLNYWFSANGLKLNAEKTKFLAFHLNHQNTSQRDYFFLPPCFNVVSSVRFLGVEIDSSLTWRAHVNQLLLKLSKAFYALLTLS